MVNEGRIVFHIECAESLRFVAVKCPLDMRSDYREVNEHKIVQYVWLRIVKCKKELGIFSSLFSAANVFVQI